MNERSALDRSDGLCHPRIDAAGLPHREEIILERERNLYPLMVNRVLGLRRDVPEHWSAVVFPLQRLEEIFATREAAILPAAAFLAGRCQPAPPASPERLTSLLRALVSSLDASRLGVMADAYVEAAMSLALRGDPESARRLLTPLVADGADPGTGYLAAFYLAQLGDPSGYPAMLAALRSESDHTRLMAVRHLIAFKPYDGQTIQGKCVDIRGELIQRLKDHEPYVRVEVPYYLAEAGVADLAALLEPVARRDRSRDVREAARDILERFNASTNGQST